MYFYKYDLHWIRAFRKTLSLDKLSILKDFCLPLPQFIAQALADNKMQDYI